METRGMAMKTGGDGDKTGGDGEIWSVVAKMGGSGVKISLKTMEHRLGSLCVQHVVRRCRQVRKREAVVKTRATVIKKVVMVKIQSPVVKTSGGSKNEP